MTDTKTDSVVFPMLYTQGGSRQLYFNYGIPLELKVIPESMTEFDDVVEFLNSVYPEAGDALKQMRESGIEYIYTDVYHNEILYSYLHNEPQRDEWLKMNILEDRTDQLVDVETDDLNRPRLQKKDEAESWLQDNTDYSGAKCNAILNAISFLIVSRSLFVAEACKEKIMDKTGLCEEEVLGFDYYQGISTVDSMINLQGGTLYSDIEFCVSDAKPMIGGEVQMENNGAGRVQDIANLRMLLLGENYVGLKLVFSGGGDTGDLTEISLTRLDKEVEAEFDESYNPVSETTEHPVAISAWYEYLRDEKLTDTEIVAGNIARHLMNIVRYDWINGDGGYGEIDYNFVSNEVTVEAWRRETSRVSFTHAGSLFGS